MISIFTTLFNKNNTQNPSSIDNSVKNTDNSVYSTKSAISTDTVCKHPNRC